MQMKVPVTRGRPRNGNKSEWPICGSAAAVVAGRRPVTYSNCCYRWVHLCYWATPSCYCIRPGKQENGPQIRVASVAIVTHSTAVHLISSTTGGDYFLLRKKKESNDPKVGAEWKWATRPPASEKSDALDTHTKHTKKLRRFRYKMAECRPKHKHVHQVRNAKTGDTSKVGHLIGRSTFTADDRRPKRSTSAIRLKRLSPGGRRWRGERVGWLPWQRPHQLIPAHAVEFINRQRRAASSWLARHSTLTRWLDGAFQSKSP